MNEAKMRVREADGLGLATRERERPIEMAGPETLGMLLDRTPQDSWQAEWECSDEEGWDPDDSAELDASETDWNEAPERIRPPRPAPRAKAPASQMPFGEPPSFLLTPALRFEPAPERAVQRADPLSPERRSALMAKVKSAKTKPELALRDALRAARLTGYRLAPKNLPGKPDFAFGKARVAVFVDGCFWHGCSSCYRQPEGNKEWVFGFSCGMGFGNNGQKGR